MPTSDYGQNVDSWNLSVNGKYAAAIFFKFKKSIAIGRPGFYQKHVASKNLVRITLIISIFKEIMQQKKGAYVSSHHWSIPVPILMFLLTSFYRSGILYMLIGFPRKIMEYTNLK